MASNYGTKSRIPLRNLKKELSTENSRKTLTKSEPPKLLKTKGKTTVLKEICVRNEMSSEIKQSKNNAQKVTTKDKAVIITKKAPLQKQNQRTRRSTIETLSKEIASHLKIEKSHEDNLSAESVDNEGNALSHETDGAASKRTSGEGKATSPSLLVQPKKYVPHGGIILKPTVKKITAVFKPFKFQPSPAKLRRSQSEYDPDFERPKAENIQPQQKHINIAHRNKAGQNLKPTKSSTLPKRQELSSGVQNKLQKEIPVQANNPHVPPRMSKNGSATNTAAKPLHTKPKPVRRSNTINNAFDTERPKAENIPPQQKGMNVAKNDKADQRIKLTKASTFSKQSSGTENKFQKDIKAHSKNPLVPPRRPKNVSVENKPAKPLHLNSKPLRRSNTIHAFDTVPVLNKAFGIRKKEQLINSKRITEQENFENNTPVTPENHQLSQIDVEDIEKHLTPKKEIPHKGLVFKIQATKSNEKKLRTFSNVD